MPADAVDEDDAAVGADDSAGRWPRKFGHAFRGMWRAVRSEDSFAVHLPAALLVIVVAAWLGIPGRDWALLLAAIGSVLVAELVNTAIESLARALGPRRHPRIRDALDVSSAAVLLAAAFAVVVGLLVLGPPLWGALAAAVAGR